MYRISTSITILNQQNQCLFVMKKKQRLPRYLLLLNGLIEHTPNTHPDYNSLVQAHHSIQQVAEHVEEAMNTADSNKKLIEIDRMIEGEHEVIHTPFIHPTLPLS